MLRVATPDIHILQPVNLMIRQNRPRIRSSSYLWIAFEDHMPRNPTNVCFLQSFVEVVLGE